MPDVDIRSKENRKLIDAMLESRQIATRKNRKIIAGLNERIAAQDKRLVLLSSNSVSTRIDHLEDRITRCENSKSEYIAHLESRIGNLEARAH